jgi:hypothetical protein
MVAEQKQTKTLRFQNEKIEEEMIYAPRALLEIMLFATHPCETTCNQMLPMIINGCLCNYFSKLDEIWSSFQLGCDYDLFHP